MKRTTLLLLCCYVLAQHKAFAQHPNVLIGTNNAPNEPSICINPKNPQQVVAGANISSVYRSNDGGLNWQLTPVSCSWGIWGDPVISVDTTGAFFYLHLSNPPSPGNWIDRIIAQKSTDGGATWPQESFMGLNGTKAQDKHWIATDWANNNLYVTWTQFDNYGTSAATDSSVIMFAKSTDGGASWSPAKRISQLAGDCVDSDDTAEGAVPAVGPNGQVYVAWANRSKIWFDRSLDGGNTWLDNDIFVGEQPGGWDYGIPGIYRANGLPVTACDTSGGAYNGTIYVNWTDQRNGEDDTDVWLSKSTDGGNTWSPAIRVNDDTNNRQQFFTWMTIDQTNGWLWFVFYDRRNYTDINTDVYMALSTDGGATFQNFKISESPFAPSSVFFFGDYTNVSAHNNIVRPIWTRLDGNGLSVWTAIVNPDVLVATKEPQPLVESIFSTEDPYPNPFSEHLGFSFKLRRHALVSLLLLDLQGNIRSRLIDHEWRGAGKYLEKIDARQQGLTPGAYFILLDIDGKTERKKIVFVD